MNRQKTRLTIYLFLAIIATIARPVYAEPRLVEITHIENSPTITSSPLSLLGWTGEGDQDNAYFGSSVASAGDVNGDGYNDVIIGAPNFDNGQIDEGRVFAYYGSSTGLSTNPDWTSESDQAGALFGGSVGSAGDVNGDGFDDVIISAPLYDNGQIDEGRAYIFLGSASGLSNTPAWTAESNKAIAEFGTSVRSAGDVNGDGFSDVIIGSSTYDINGYQGRVFVYYGSASGISTIPSWTADSDQAGAQFGQSVSTAGDVNGDGYDDVIVGSFAYDNGQNNEGRAYLYYGSTSGLSTFPAWISENNVENSWYGRSVGNAGDVNGDGYDDVIVGAPSEFGFQFFGWTYVYYGSNLGLSPFPSWTASGKIAENFGCSVGTAGDMNADGYDDVIIGAQAGDNGMHGEGIAAVYYGSDGGLSTSYDWAESDQVDAGFGFSVGTAGDVNGDGTDDVIIGSIYFDNGQVDEGRAFLYYGFNYPPVANAGFDQTVYTNSLVTLNGSGSSDPDNNYPLSFQWIQTGGNTVVLDEPTSVTPKFTAPSDPAIFTFELTVIDNSGFSDPTPDTVIINVINQAPNSNAGPDQYVNRQSLVTLAGSVVDPDGDYPLVHRWTQTGGPLVSLSDLTSLTPTFTAPANPSILTFSLSVTDSLGKPDPSPDTVIINVINQEPISDAGVDQIVNTLSPVVLSGSGTDPDGDLPLNYHWAQTGGISVELSNPTSLNPSFTAPSDPSILIFSLTVTDNLGLSETTPDTVSITVNNQTPNSLAGQDQSVNTLSLVTLLGDGTDPDGDLPLTYMWSQISGTTVTLSDPNGANPNFIAPSDPTTLTFSLIVTDSLGAKDPTPDTVDIIVHNQAPIADAGPDQGVNRLSLVNLLGSGTDPDGDYPLTYLWTQTSGPTVTLSDPTIASPSFIAPNELTMLTFSLSVTDSLHLSDLAPDTVVITVNNQAPVSNAGLDQNVNTLSLVTLSGSGSDLDGDLPVTYFWTQTGGTIVNLSDPTLNNPTFTAPSDPTILTFSLTVKDSLGLPDPTPDTTVITVNNQAPTADAGPDQNVQVFSSVTLSGSGVDPDDDLPLTFLWTQTSGPVVTLSNYAIANPSFIVPYNAIVLTFKLVVTDSLGLTSLDDEVTINVISNRIFLPFIIR